MTEMATATASTVAATPPTRREHVGFSLRRVGVIATNTLTEAIRQKVWIFLVIIGLVLIALAIFFSQYSFADQQEQIKFIKDTSLGVISVISTLIAIVGTAQLLPNEVENRTIYTILAKPVRRFEFLLGKFCGSLLLLALSVAAMCVMFALVLWIKEQSQIRELSQTYLGQTSSDKAQAQAQITEVQIQAHDVDLIKAVVADFSKAVLVAAITLLVSTFSTSLVFNVAVPFMVYVAGMLRGSAGEMWAAHHLLMAIVSIVPDFSLFNLADDINLGKVVPWVQVVPIVIYAAARTIVMLIAAHLVFSRREI